MKEKILFIAAYVPFPPVGGAYQRTYNLLREAAKEYEIFFVGFEKSNRDRENVKRLEEFCKSAYCLRLEEDWSKICLLKGLMLNIFSSKPFTANKYHKTKIVSKIKALLGQEEIDILHLDVVDVAEYINDFNAKKKILVHHNVESDLYHQMANRARSPLKKLFWFIQHRKMRKFEKLMCHRFTWNACVSHFDRRTLEQIAPTARFHVVPNGVDIKYFYPAAGVSVEKDLVFVGSLDWPANLDAISYYCTDILPEIRKLNMDLTLKVIGKVRDNQKLPFKGRTHVNVLGFVPDIRPHVWSSIAFIVPLRIGGGTRLKILDAMAMGIPVISTSIGCEGLDVENGKNILIADSPKDFAFEIKRVLEDERLRNTLRAEGRSLVEWKYSWKTIYKEQKKLYSER